MGKRTASGGQARRQNKDKSKLPRRLCKGPNDKWCGSHRGCCNCFEHNASGGKDSYDCWGPMDWVPETELY